MSFRRRIALKKERLFPGGEFRSVRFENKTSFRRRARLVSWKARRRRAERALEGFLMSITLLPGCARCFYSESIANAEAEIARLDVAIHKATVRKWAALILAVIAVWIVSVVFVGGFK